MKVLFLSLMFAASSSFAAVSTFDLDTSHGEIGFDITHLMISHVKGRFNKYEGTLKFDEEKRELSAVDVKIDAKSIDTNEKKRDGHLSGPDFFDADKHPNITFKSDKAVSFAGKNAKVTGNLTIRGKTKPVVLDVDFLGSATDPMGAKRIAFTARATINRKDFDMKWNKNLDTGGVAVGEDVSITIEGEAIKKK